MQRKLERIHRRVKNANMIMSAFNTLLLTMDRLFRQKVDKETLDLNYILAQMNLTDINRIFHPITAKYTFFSSAQGIFYRTDLRVSSQNKS